MKPDETNIGPENLKDIDVIFTPLEHIRCIENVIFNLERTRQELLKVAEGMEPINGS